MSIFIEFIEATLRDRKKNANDLAVSKAPFHRASDSMTAETFKKYIFGENFAED